MKDNMNNDAASSFVSEFGEENEREKELFPFVYRVLRQLSRSDMQALREPESLFDTARRVTRILIDRGCISENVRRKQCDRATHVLRDSVTLFVRRYE